MNKSIAIKTGVTDFYLAKATHDSGTNKVTYGEPGVFAGTASVSSSVQKNENKVYESDELINSRSRTSGVNITLTTRTADPASEMEVIYGQTASGEEYIIGPDDMGGHYAVGWAKKRSDGSYLCQWYLWATGSKDDESDETATDTENSATDSYTFAAASSPEPRADGRTQMKRVKHAKDAAEMRAFFASVMPA